MSAQEHRDARAGRQPRGEFDKAPGPLQLHCAVKETRPTDENLRGYVVATYGYAWKMSPHQHLDAKYAKASQFDAAMLCMLLSCQRTASTLPMTHNDTNLCRLFIFSISCSSKE